MAHKLGWWLTRLERQVHQCMFRDEATFSVCLLLFCGQNYKQSIVSTFYYFSQHSILENFHPCGTAWSKLSRSLDIKM